MELTFKHERMSIIRRLRGMTLTEIDKKMQEISGGKYSYNIERWQTGSVSPNSLKKVELMAEATGVPIGFYYYNNVDITLNDNVVTIFIYDTKQTITFKFIQP